MKNRTGDTEMIRFSIFSPFPENIEDTFFLKVKEKYFIKELLLYVEKVLVP